MFEFWPGPMEGVMTPALLRASADLALVPRWMTPFYRVTGIPRLRHLNDFLIPFSPLPVTLQLMGTDPETVGRTAALFASLGVTSFNLNCGCPSRQVTSGGAGGGALRNPDGIRRMVEGIKAHIPDLPLSVKLRTGWSDPAEQRTILPMLANTGCVEKLFLHFRTVKEQYSPATGREERFREAFELAGNIPLVLNGDINTVEDAAQLLMLFPQSAGIMSARGWLRDPFLFRRIAGEAAPGVEEGREQFFRAVVGEGFPVPKSIELSNLLWGRENNPYFKRLIELPPHSEFR